MKKLLLFVLLAVLTASPVAHAAPEIRGMIGVGTWKTQAEFKEIQVVKDGKTLFQSDFSKGLDGWNLPRGKWEVADGVLRQMSGEENTAAYVGDPNWSDYTLSLKARKLGGAEGFLIYFQSPDHRSTTRWNIGGWNNAKHAFEVAETPPTQIAGSVEIGRWVDIKIELQGNTIKGYLDGALIQQATRPDAGDGRTDQWGDQGDSTFRNPILPGDFSDPDAIRVGDDYYLITSTFQYSPGMAILHSKDLVNWRYLGGTVPDLTQIGPNLNWDKMNRYNRGIYAGALRFHDGKFWMFFTTMDEGVFMTTAAKPEGPWAPLHQVWDAQGWDDPCPFWDDDGKAYLLLSKPGNEWWTHLFPMAPDGKSLDVAGDVVVDKYQGSEGNKILKIDGTYFIFHNQIDGPGNRTGVWMRSKSLAGPWGKKLFLWGEGPERDREPNQGALVQTKAGDWWFLTHHGRGGFYEGRTVSLLPVKWQDGWPVVDAPGPGVMVWQHPKPIKSLSSPTLQSDDDFQKPVLAPQWEWNYQPRAEKWSLSEKPGVLRLKAFPSLEKGNFSKVGNFLTQRIIGTGGGEVVTCLDASGMAEGQTAGLAFFWRKWALLGVAQSGRVKTIRFLQNGQITDGPTLNQAKIFLKASIDGQGGATFSFSLDEKSWTPFGERFAFGWADYRGTRVGLATWNDAVEEGIADFDWFRYDFSAAQRNTSAPLK